MKMVATAELADKAADIMARIRARAPWVHCITNSVAQQYTANVLLAAGAIPSMTIAREEIGAFVAGADALLVNLGTFDAERRAAIEAAFDVAAARHIPWVLDPAFIDRAPARAQFARELVGRRPAAVRLNQAEFGALSELEPSREAGARFAQAQGTIVALTGAVDQVTDGSRRAAIANGDPLMRLVTALGCAGSALVAAALAVEKDSFVATVAALTALGVAGEIAAKEAAGPGSFGIGIIDALHGLDQARVRTRARIS